MNKCTRALLVLTLLASAAGTLSAQIAQKSAPTEPDFVSTNGAAIVMRGINYTIKVTVVMNGQQWVRNEVDLTVNGATTTYQSGNNINRPINSAADGIQVFVGTPGDDVLVPDGSASWNGLPVLMIGLAGDDILVGTNNGADFGDVILGGPGNDTMLGRGGPDRIWCGSGSNAADGGDDADQIVGGSDNDDKLFDDIAARGDFRGAGVYVLPKNERSATNRVSLQEGADFPASANGLFGAGGNDDLWGELGNDAMYGDRDDPMSTSGNNYLDGGEGDDVITGGNGQDSIYGDEGADTLIGGHTVADLADHIFGQWQSDTIWGGAGSDFLYGGTNRDRIYAYRPEVFGVRIIDDGGNVLEGEADTDTLVGARGPDKMRGGEGNDTIDAEYNGNNTILGEAGGDTIRLGRGNDTVSCGDGDDIVTSNGGNHAVWGGAGIDQITGGVGVDFIDGGDGNDRLYDGNENDRIVDVDTWFNILDGGEGNDELICFDGNILGSWDQVTGGNGDDTFWADEQSQDASSQQDTITDQVLNETWNVFAGPLGSPDGRVEPTR